MSKNILISVSGLTPQVITEALFCLMVKKKICIDEVYVITTKRGRDIILGKEALFDGRKVRLKNEIQALVERHKLPSPKFEETDRFIIVAKEESLELSDVRTDKDNILFPNKVAAFIREKSAEPDCALYCLITGGRKSMSVHLANTLALFAREQDLLLHVLTKEKHEFKNFFPLTKKEAQDCELAEIPFVRLRSLLAPELKEKGVLEHSYHNIVQLAQRQLKIMSSQIKLILDMEKRELRYGSESQAFEPIEFLFYYYFVDLKLKGKDKITVSDFTGDDTRDTFIRYFEEYYPNIYVKEKKWAKNGFSKEDFRVRRSKVNSKLKSLFKDPDDYELFFIDVEKIYASSKYFLRAPKGRFLIK